MGFFGVLFLVVPWSPPLAPRRASGPCAAVPARDAGPAALPGGAWRAWSVPLGTQRLALGAVLGAPVAFLLISVVVFVVAAKIFRVEVKK